MSEKKEKSYCYIDHANKTSEKFAANPYRFWLKQVRRQREEREFEDRNTGARAVTDPADSRLRDR